MVTGQADQEKQVTMESTEIPAASDSATTPMSKEQREQFDRDGYLVIPNALSAEEVAYYNEVIDRIYARGEGGGRALRPRARCTCSPRCTAARRSPRCSTTRRPSRWCGRSSAGTCTSTTRTWTCTRRSPFQKPFRFEWHQDGGRQNREIETDPRPRLSVKLAYWLSDVSVEGRGNFKVVPGSHLRNWIDGPPRRDVEWPEPEGAVEVLANPGDAVFFDRRIWHTRTNNYSDVTRKGMFFAYTLRWIAVRDEVDEPSGHVPISPP